MKLHKLPPQSTFVLNPQSVDQSISDLSRMQCGSMKVCSSRPSAAAAAAAKAELGRTRQRTNKRTAALRSTPHSQQSGLSLPSNAQLSSLTSTSGMRGREGETAVVAESGDGEREGGRRGERVEAVCGAGGLQCCGDRQPAGRREPPPAVAFVRPSVRPSASVVVEFCGGLTRALRRSTAPFQFEVEMEMWTFIFS